MTDPIQTGSRNFEFIVPVIGTAELDPTDFFVTYEAAEQNEQTELNLLLNSVWEAASADFGLARRQEFEARLRDLAWNFTGKKGILTIDKGLTGVVVHTDITFRAIEITEADNNAKLEYSIRFGFPISESQGTEIARTGSFDGDDFDADNFIIENARQDRTVFKDVYRSAPVRVPTGSGIQEVRVTGIKQAVTGVTDLARRQAAEDEVKVWTERIGNEGALIIDGIGLGTAHLTEAVPDDLTLSDAVVFTLLFLKGYSS